MSRILELQDPGNFSLQYSNSIPAQELTIFNGQPVYAKLTEVIIPVIFDKPILNTRITTTLPTGKIWEFGGTLRQVVDTGLGECIVQQRSLSLIGRNLVLFSKVSGDYSLRYKPPKWFISLEINIYQYEGSDTSAIENDLEQIEAKIDALS